jgi:hypothetical protein
MKTNSGSNEYKKYEQSSQHLADFSNEGSGSFNATVRHLSDGPDSIEQPELCGQDEITY